MEDLHSRWSHRWVNPKAVCRKSSVEGLGTFAKESILKGEIVCVFGGVIVHISEINEYTKKMGDVGIQIEDEFFMVPTTRKELEKTGVINHSCNPNLGLLNNITQIAIRDIKIGEELLFDYAFSESDSTQKNRKIFDCKCDSKSCRKVITLDDWKIKELQKKYGEYFSPYLKKKIGIK